MSVEAFDFESFGYQIERLGTEISDDSIRKDCLVGELIQVGDSGANRGRGDIWFDANRAIFWKI